MECDIHIHGADGFAIPDGGNGSDTIIVAELHDLQQIYRIQRFPGSQFDRIQNRCAGVFPLHSNLVGVGFAALPLPGCRLGREFLFLIVEIS